MSYRESVAPSAETRAIAATSLKASGIGALLVTLYFLSISIFGGWASAGELAAGLPIFALIYLIAFVAGTIATGLCLLLFGTVVARSARSKLAAPSGIAIAVAAACAASLGVGALFGGFEGALSFGPLALFFALPAAIIYRREILIERLTD